MWPTNLKLTPRSQGYRFRKDGWVPGKWYDIRRVGKLSVIAINQNGHKLAFPRDDNDAGWIRVGSTRAVSRVEPNDGTK